jgi:triose/dihydroxyacetone kinase / FAD-AMP lyase (cyclizing)
VDPKTLELAIRTACNAVIAAEPNLTKWDTIMGDGDCGETFKTGARGNLFYAHAKLLINSPTELLKQIDIGLAKEGSILSICSAMSEITETKMGGTLGAILSIFFNALVSEIAGGSSIIAAPAQACRDLEKHTTARVGHRTIMDVLIPATRALEETGEIGMMLDAAKRGAESTKALDPVLGRATYVGGMKGKELPPDPGAWGLMEAIQGLAQALSN